MAFTAQDVKTLREQTGCGMMDCKKVLQEADGDLAKAAELLREKGLAAANKKAGRIASEGMVFAMADEDSGIGAVVEVNSETDFVAKNESFQQFVKDLAEVIIREDPADVDALLAAKLGEGTVQDELQEKILVIGENLKIRRFARFCGKNCAYVHGGGTHGVLVLFDASDEVAKKPEFATVSKDIAMHITVFNPPYISREDVPADVVEKEKEILKAQAMQDEKNKGKPEAIIEKMVAGRVNKFFEENCLLDQKFVRDDKITVGQYLAQAEKDLGGPIKVLQFARFEKGEGLEKKSDDFAAEVAGMIK
ncbi:translation elongation factor Ts [Ruminococcaceae bacterium OttesenSCG-928-O06]|nr:translation elongation factor Ts [Ruminococcaceae bacterium OttesenSCG-928-O06]